MGPVHKCDLHSYFITLWKGNWLQGKRNEHYWNKGKGTKTEMNVLIIPYGLLCKYNSTYEYTNVANRIQPRLWTGKKKKKKKLPYACATVPGSTMLSSMSHGCLALIWKSKVARGLSISRILSKWPPIGVMQQSHVMKWWDLSFHIVFPTVQS